MQLTQSERDTPLFRKLKKHYEQRLADHRLENDKRLNADDTARLRGMIAEDLYFLSLAEPVKGMKEVGAAD